MSVRRKTLFSLLIPIRQGGAKFYCLNDADRKLAQWPPVASKPIINKKPDSKLSGFLQPILKGLERTLEADHALPSVFLNICDVSVSIVAPPFVAEASVGDFWRNGEARNQLVSYVSRNSGLAPIVVSTLNVEGCFFGCDVLEATPDSPIAAPTTVVLINGSFGSVTALYPSRQLIGQVNIQTNFTSPFFDDRVVSCNTSDRTPALSVFQTTNDVRYIFVDDITVATFFKSDNSREAVSTSEGVRD